MCVFLQLYVLIVLKLCIVSAVFFSFLYFLHCVIVFASFFKLCTLCTILIIIIIRNQQRSISNTQQLRT